MFKRMALILTLAVVLLASGAQVAFAWSNGPRNDSTQYKTVNGVGFGTHDWILTHGARIAGSRADWLDLDEACRASEYPDVHKTSGFLHTFRPTGRSQGGPQECADLYHKAVVAYQAGDKKKASYYIGVMSHYYTDILQPFHTITFTTKNDDIHRTYERIIETPIKDKDDLPYLMAADNVVEPVSDVRKMAVSAALYSRSKGHILLPALRDRASLSNPAVKSVTRDVLSRGANDLADIIASVPTGDGKAAPPAKIVKRITKRRVTLGRKVGLYTQCLDQNGKPVRGARVVFLWPTKTGTFKMVRYSAADGWVHDYREITGLRSGRKTRVRAYAVSSGETTAVSEWFVPRR